VSPWYIHADMDKITPIFTECPIKKQFCWHEKVGTTGSECEVDKEIPPCCVYDTQKLITRIAHKL